MSDVQKRTESEHPHSEVVPDHQNQKPEIAKSVDEELVHRAVRELNQIYTTKALETACLIGEYVIKEFFGCERTPRLQWADSNASFRALARHPDLRFSQSYLWTAVAVVEQLAELPDAIGRQLPLSHHRLLLPLRNASTKTRLAKQSIELGLSKRELAMEIGLLRKRSNRRRARRSAQPDVVKALSRLIEASENFVLAASTGEVVLGERSVNRTQNLLERLDVDLDAVRCVVEMLRSRQRTSPRFNQTVGTRGHLGKLDSRVRDA